MTDRIFTPLLREFARLRRQLQHDLGYLRVGLDTYDRYLRTLELQIDSSREDFERRIERLIAAFGIAIGVGQIMQGQPMMMQAGGMLISLIAAYFAIPPFIRWLDKLADWSKKQFRR